MSFHVRKLTSEEAPKALTEIHNPPEALWAIGVLPQPETVLITIVGARRNSPYGKEACETLVGGLRGYDIAIVSGLAIGIDTIAHTTAMRSGLPTIAVPGSSLEKNVLYPHSNLLLAQKIVEHGGALLTEFPPETPAAPWTFPKRNRIMAGLSKATLIIEAEQKSGTLITARLATDFNRDVLAVPGSIFSPLSYGPNKLIEMGATPVHTSEDILHALGFSPNNDTEEVDYRHLPESEQKIVMALNTPKQRDQLFEELGLSVSEGNILLMKMEMAGIVVDSPEGIRRAQIN